MRISYNNYLDTLTSTAITVLTVATNYPFTNAQDQRLSQQYRTTAVTSQTIILDLGSAKSISTAAIISHNFTSSVSVTIDANTSNSWGSPATSKTIIYNAGMMLNFFTPVSYQWWRFTISDPTNTNGYLSIGRLWLGDYLTIDPSSSIDYKVTKKRSDRVIHGRGQQKFSSIGSTWKEFNLSFPPTDYPMIDSISLMYDTIGNHTSCIFCNFDDLRGIVGLIEPTYVSIQNEIDFTNNEGRKYSYDLTLMEEK
jgi:hypothetical protein